MSKIKHNLAGILCILLAVSFLAIGVYRGETETVFRKAINICLECIGIG